MCIRTFVLNLEACPCRRVSRADTVHSGCKVSLDPCYLACCFFYLPARNHYTLLFLSTNVHPPRGTVSNLKLMQGPVTRHYNCFLRPPTMPRPSLTSWAC